MQMNELYRPRTWSDVVGQEKMVQRIQALAKRGLAGRAYFLSGQSGTGKTSIGRLIAAEVASELATKEMNAHDVELDFVLKMELSWHTTALAKSGDKTGRAYIFNEAHLLRSKVISRLLTTLEQIPPHCVVIFTSTTEGTQTLWEDYDDSSPLLSRCLRLDLSRRGLCTPFAQRMLAICEKEGLGKPTLQQCERVLKEEGNNLRAGIHRIEAGEFLECGEALAVA